MEQLDLEFAEDASRMSARGFAPGLVIEIAWNDPLSVSLLFSPPEVAHGLDRATSCISIVSAELEVDFASWLRRELQRNCLDDPWRAHRRFGDVLVDVEHFGQRAVLLTVEAESGVEPLAAAQLGTGSRYTN